MVQLAVRVEELGRPLDYSPDESGYWLQKREGRKREAGEEEGWKEGVLLYPEEKTVFHIKNSHLI